MKNAQIDKVCSREFSRCYSLLYTTYLTLHSYYKTAFVPKAKRIAAPITALESIKTVFKISDRELIRIAGVDGFLFLQYLQLLLRIFIPMAIVILPILLPINKAGEQADGVSGLDSFAWPNVAIRSKIHRLWAHLILAVCVVIWVCFNFFLALRKFVRLRQTILTMPEHRIRASATTILVQSIPRKWLTTAALDALYDVFPGGIKDIWINRNFDTLQDKVNKRSKCARALESAETNLIIKCTKKHREMEEAKAKKDGKKKKTKKEKSTKKCKRTKKSPMRLSITAQMLVTLTRLNSNCSPCWKRVHLQRPPIHLAPHRPHARRQCSQSRYLSLVRACTLLETASAMSDKV